MDEFTYLILLTKIDAVSSDEDKQKLADLIIDSDKNGYLNNDVYSFRLLSKLYNISNEGLLVRDIPYNTKVHKFDSNYTRSAIYLSRGLHALDICKSVEDFRRIFEFIPINYMSLETSKLGPFRSKTIDNVKYGFHSYTFRYKPPIFGSLKYTTKIGNDLFAVTYTPR